MELGGFSMSGRWRALCVRSRSETRLHDYFELGLKFYVRRIGLEIRAILTRLLRMELGWINPD